MPHTPGSTPLSGGSPRGPAGGEGRLSRWMGRLGSALLVTAIGVLLGQQYMKPDKRVLPVIATVILAGVAWRLDFITSIGLTIFLLPYPRTTTFGTTNTAIALLIAILWLVNASQGRAPTLRRTPMDVPVVGLILVYVCSFYNVTDPEGMAKGLAIFQIFIGSVLCYYVIVSNVNTTKALEKIHTFQLLCATSVLLLAVYELGHPGVFVGWIELGASGARAGEEGFHLHDRRIGSAFNDYELLSEFCAITMLFGVFLLARATSVVRRVLLSAFLLLTLFVLFATVTRGAFVSLGAGLASLLWTTRRRMQFVPLVIGISLFITLFMGMNFYVSHYTPSGDMFGRLSQTHFEGGVPDTRVGTWGPGLERAMQHPWIGWGPYYGEAFGFKFVYPHDIFLYYANIVGFVGLGFFLLLLVELARMTAPTVDNLRHHDYARAFQIVARAQFVTFVVNEIKIDYLRNSVYQTVVWAMFSMWVATYLVARSNQAAEASARLAIAR